MLKYLYLIPFLLIAQIETQVRDDDPSLFTNQRIYHAPPKPLFTGRSHTLDFITNIPKDSVESAAIFFKTDSMQYYQEFLLEGRHGHYNFKYDPNIYPGTRLQYYFVIKSKTNIYGTPINDKGELTPVNKLLIDPVQYFKQRSRLNQ